MAATGTREQRQQHILDVLSRNQVDSQEELRDLLLAEGMETTQSTLSRDLRALGVVKGPAGYRVPGRDASAPERLLGLARVLAPGLLSVDWGGNLVVLRTGSSAAAREAAGRIEAARLPQAAAALPCDDAVLVVARTQAYAREMVQALRERPRRALRR